MTNSLDSALCWLVVATSLIQVYFREIFHSRRTTIVMVQAIQHWERDLRAVSRECAA